MSKSAKKRPKVRYVASPPLQYSNASRVVAVGCERPLIDYLAICHNIRVARRLAAALNFHEATKRGEL